MQLNIDWLSAERHRENNPVSQQHHDENLTHFAKQDKQVYDLLMKGEVLTNKVALNEYGIGSLSRRITTLTDAGIKIEKEFKNVDGSKFMEYSIKQNGQ